MQIIPFSDLEDADLIIDAVYEGGNTGNIADDPLAKLLRGGNAGNFRFCGSVSGTGRTASIARPVPSCITGTTSNPVANFMILRKTPI
jgi:hypothetical protein